MKILFVKFEDEGSAMHRGDRAAELLRDAGQDAVAVDSCELPEEAALVVLVKYLERDYAREAKARGCLVVLDALEWNWDNLKNLKSGEPVDGIIVGNQETADRVSGYPVRHVYHHTFNLKPPEGLRPFGVVYAGDTRCTARPWEVVSRVDCVPYYHRFADSADTERAYLDKVASYPMHINIRDTPFKPQSKISFAATCHANIICNRTAGGVIELLGEEYPYLLNGRSADEVLDKAESDYPDGDDWLRGLEIMATVREKTSDAAVVKQYMDFFKELWCSR